MALKATIYKAHLQLSDMDRNVYGDHALTFLILLAGPLTALPLMLFAAAARRLRLATLGLMQDVSPTLQLACGVFFFREPFDAEKLIGFAFIWVALAVYTAHAWRSVRAPSAGGG